MAELKNEILMIVKDNDYSLQDLKIILDPISTYIENPIFKNNIDEIVNILTKDRNQDGKFELDDLKLLGNDITGITSLVTAILMLIAAIPTVKLNYSQDETETIILKALAYIFLIVIPKSIDQPWNIDEKEQILDIALTIYELVRSSQIAQHLVEKVANWFRGKGWCKCMLGGDGANQVVIENKMPKLKLGLHVAMNNIHDKREIHVEIKNIKSSMVQ